MRMVTVGETTYVVSCDCTAAPPLPAALAPTPPPPGSPATSRRTPWPTVLFSSE